MWNESLIGTCNNCIYEDGKPITCNECEGMYPEIHPHSQEIRHEVFQANHSVQYKEYPENSSNEIVVSNYIQEKEGPPKDSDIRQLIREECGIEEVKNVVEQPVERRLRIIESLQNFRVIPMRVEDIASWDLDNNTWGGWGEVIGTVSVDAGAQESCYGGEGEETDVVTSTDDVLPPGFKNDDDSEEDIHFLEELLSDNSIPLTKDESSDSDHQDDPSFLLPPPEPPDAEFDFKLDAEILVMMNTIDEFKYLDLKDEFDDYYSLMFVIRIFLPFLICSKMFLSFLSAESEDTIFDPGFTPHWLKFLVFGYLSRSVRSSHPFFEISLGKSISLISIA
nr:hypothetical protein [Tanacetum cinerariifolium]